MHSNQKKWRVRVYRKMEDWVEVQADDAIRAEALAAQLPFVASVFRQSAISADKPLASTDPLGVLGDDDGN
jgi:hypothetical protein